LRLFSIILGFALATVFGTGLSVFALIGSQGMNARTPVLPTIAAYMPMLAIAHGLGAAAGLIPAGLAKGQRTWRFAVCGFAAGGALEGLLFPICIIAPKHEGLRSVLIAAYLASLLLPAAGGLAGLFLESKSRNPG
jgi:hypothetical protein